MNAFDIAQNHLKAEPAAKLPPARETLFDDADSVAITTAWHIARAWRRLGVKLDANQVTRQLLHSIFQQPTSLADAALAAAEAAALAPDREQAVAQQHKFRCRVCGSESTTTVSWPCRGEDNRCDLASVDGDGFEVWD
jgi:hypothetical protein